MRVGLPPALILALLTACAPPLRDPWGMTLARGGDPGAPPPPPERMRVDLEIVPRVRGAGVVTARAYLEPGRRARLDFTGFTGTIAATWHWEDGVWILIRHDDRSVRRGLGSVLVIEDTGVRLPDVHAVLGVLWGRTLPGYPGGTGAGDTIRWTHGGEAWEAVLDARTGLASAARAASLELRYGEYAARGGRAVPSEFTIFPDGAPALRVRVTGWDDAPAWPRDPFVLRVPGGYGEL